MHEYTMNKYVDVTKKYISLIGTIVRRGHWLGNPANIKVENNGKLIHIRIKATLCLLIDKLWVKHFA